VEGLDPIKLEAFGSLVELRLKKREVERVMQNVRKRRPQTNSPVPSDKEVDDEVADMAMKNNLTYNQLKAQFAAAGIDLNTLREQVRIEISWQRLIVGMGAALPGLTAAASSSQSGG
jgi:peptidyl-prolyl cis-trans isomerase SurA